MDVYPLSTCAVYWGFQCLHKTEVASKCLLLDQTPEGQSNCECLKKSDKFRACLSVCEDLIMKHLCELFDHATKPVSAV